MFHHFEKKHANAHFVLELLIDCELWRRAKGACARVVMPASLNHSGSIFWQR
jgi:hypothetical protein